MAADRNDPRLLQFLEDEQKADKPSAPKKPKQPKKEAVTAPSGGKRQRRIFKKKRGGIVLTREEVKAIKAGRKKLRRELRERGIKSRREFEVTAATLGLYFDKKTTLIPWLLRHWLAGLLTLLALLTLTLFLFSLVTRTRGLFTINLSDGLFKEGFVLSDTAGFEHPSVQLFAEPATDVPCVSIKRISTDVDEIDGEHNDDYFAYTFYIRNEGENTVSYDWVLEISSESMHLSKAAWVMVFENGEMRFYAHANSETGEVEALPPYGDNTRGYFEIPISKLAEGSNQFEPILTVNGKTYYRVVPDKFISDTVVTMGSQTDVAPMGVNKYTVVIWLEGDDPDTTNDVIGGHCGLEINFRLRGEKEEDGDKSFWDRFKDWWDDLRFWDD